MNQTSFYTTPDARQSWRARLATFGTTPPRRRARQTVGEPATRSGGAAAERKHTPYLPPGGEPGPAALRSHHRFRVPAHRATSDVVAGAYPFLAEAGLGSAGVYIGQDAWSGGGFCFDP